MNIFDLSGQKIRKMRESLNWSREDLAGKSEVPEGTLTDIELGKTKNPGIETIKALLDAFPKSMTAPPATKNELIGKIVTLLPALHDSELRTILTSIEDFAALRGRASNKPAAGTD